MCASPQKKTIVVAEDDASIAELISDVLSEWPQGRDYQVIIEANGARALEVIRAVQPDLVLLDVMLPEVNGLQLYDILQNDPTTRDIPVLFMTAATVSSDFKRRHIQNYIAKPFRIDEFLSQIRNMLHA